MNNSNKIQEKADKLARELMNARQSSDQLRKETDTLLFNIEQMDTNVKKIEYKIDITERRADLALNEIENLVHRLLILADVNRYSVQVYDRNMNRSRIAETKLFQFIKDDDPVVRRECVRVFGSLCDNKEYLRETTYLQLIEILQMVVDEEQEAGVNLEARRILEGLMSP